MQSSYLSNFWQTSIDLQVDTILSLFCRISIWIPDRSHVSLKICGTGCAVAVYTPQSAGHIVMLGIWNVKTCWLSGTSFYWQQSKVMIQLLRTQPTVKQEEQTNTRTRGFLPHHKNHWMGGIWDWDWVYSWPSLAQQIADILQVFLCWREGEEVVVLTWQCTVSLSQSPAGWLAVGSH